MDHDNKQPIPFFSSLKGQLLIAMPSLHGSAFSDSVIYLCEHTQEGAMGLVINSPLDVHMDEIFEQLDIAIPENTITKPVFCGGPVHIDHGFVLHRSTDDSWESSINISDDVSLTTSRDIIAALAEGIGPSEALMMLGYAGWGAGQLEEELLDNAWLTVPSDRELLFETDAQQCATLAGLKAGIDISKMTTSSGHA